MLTAAAIASQPRTSVFLTAGWHNLAMLNFVIDPEVLLPYVPVGTELDLWQGRTYVSVVGFQFVNMKMLGIPVALHRHFEEVNLRFYVIRQTPDGLRRGVVFLREIATKWLVSLVARWFYNENYVTMPMRHRIESGLAEYEWWHGSRWNGLSLRVDAKAQSLGAGSEEEFIAEHYWAYTKQPDGSTIEYQVEHPPWRVCLARYDCDVKAIYGQEFVQFLREPSSVFVADGSPVVVRRGQRI